MKYVMQENTGKANTKSSASWFHRIAPGVLVAATGVGAGDLITAGLGGSAVGLIILWAAAAGAILKWFLNEGIARWQMATNTTLLEGVDPQTRELGAVGFYDLLHTLVVLHRRRIGQRVRDRGNRNVCPERRP